MPKYTVRYKSIEYYKKVYEADSIDDATEMYYNDDRLWDGTPYDSYMNILEIENEEGDVEYYA